MAGEKQLSPYDSRNAILAGFLGWTLDAFDFFILTFVLAPIAKEFGQTIPAIALTITASLATRWIGAILFGLFADRYGRRIPLIVNILYFSLIEVLSGLAPNYRVFFFLRLFYGIGMGGEWGVGASLTMESVPVRWRGFVSGLLQEGYALGFLLAAARISVLHCPLGQRRLARAVFHRGPPRAAVDFHPLKGQRARSLAPVPHGLDDLPPRHIPPLEAIRLSRSATGYDEFHCPRHSGHVPDLFAATTRLQSAAHVGLHRGFDVRRALRRVGIRIHIRRPRTAAHDGGGGAARNWSHSNVGVCAKYAVDFDGRIPDAIHGAGRLGGDPGSPQRAFSRSVAGILSRIGIPVWRVDCLRQRVFRSANGAFHEL